MCSIVDDDRADNTLDQLTKPGFESDWEGLISSIDPQIRCVWILTCSLASVCGHFVYRDGLGGEYRYHHSIADIRTCAANALLALRRLARTCDLKIHLEIRICPGWNFTTAKSGLLQWY